MQKLLNEWRRYLKEGHEVDYEKLNKVLDDESDDVSNGGKPWPELVKDYDNIIPLRNKVKIADHDELPSWVQPVVKEEDITVSMALKEVDSWDDDDDDGDDMYIFLLDDQGEPTMSYDYESLPWEHPPAWAETDSWNQMRQELEKRFDKFLST